ncbi:MAG: MFS transporter [Candidatus Hodarchaeales archaeon]
MEERKKVYAIFLWHAFFLAITMSMIDFNTIFPSLIFSLTNSKIIFGVIYSIMIGIPLIFNVVFGHILASKKFKKKYLLLGINLRALSFLGMAFFTYQFAVNDPSLVVLSFFFWIFLFSLSGGFAGIVYTDLIGKFLKKGDRGTLYAFKQLFSSIGMLMGGLIIALSFNVSNLSYPDNFAIILFLGFIGLVVASGAFWLIKEPPSEVITREPFLVFAKNIPKMLRRDNRFSKFLVVENLTSFSLMIQPFFIVYAQESFEIIYLSLYLFAIILGTITSNLIWGVVAKKSSSKAVMELCILIGAIIPLLSMILITLDPYIYTLVFVLIGFIRSGRTIGFDPYFLDITTELNRTPYLGVRGTLNILTVLLPLIGGLFIEILGYTFTFFIVAFIMMFSLYLLRNSASKSTVGSI